MFIYVQDYRAKYYSHAFSLWNLLAVCALLIFLASRLIEVNWQHREKSKEDLICKRNCLKLSQRLMLKISTNDRIKLPFSQGAHAWMTRQAVSRVLISSLHALAWLKWTLQIFLISPWELPWRCRNVILQSLLYKPCWQWKFSVAWG